MNYEFYEFSMGEYKKRLDSLRSVMKEKYGTPALAS